MFKNVVKEASANFVTDVKKCGRSFLVTIIKWPILTLYVVAMGIILVKSFNSPQNISLLAVFIGFFLTILGEYLYSLFYMAVKNEMLKEVGKHYTLFRLEDMDIIEIYMNYKRFMKQSWHMSAFIY